MLKCCNFDAIEVTDWCRRHHYQSKCYRVRWELAFFLVIFFSAPAILTELLVPLIFLQNCSKQLPGRIGDSITCQVDRKSVKITIQDDAFLPSFFSLDAAIVSILLLVMKVAFTATKPWVLDLIFLGTDWAEHRDHLRCCLIFAEGPNFASGERISVKNEH